MLLPHPHSFKIHFPENIFATKFLKSRQYQFLSIFYGLQILLFAFLGLILLLQIRLNGLVLSIEVA